MYRRLLTCLIVALSGLGASVPALAGDGGLFSSPKGFGISYDSNPLPSSGYFSLTLFADMYGVFSERSSVPGIKFQVFHNRPLCVRNFEDCDMSFYAGPGFALGYVRDFERPYLDSSGIEVAVCIDAGLKFSFRDLLVLDLSLALDIGLFIDSGRVENTSPVRLYRNGAFQFPFPQLKVMFPF